MARITLRQLLDHAAEYGYGVPAFNMNNMEQGLAIMDAAAAVDAEPCRKPARGDLSLLVGSKEAWTLLPRIAQ